MPPKVTKRRRFAKEVVQIPSVKDEENSDPDEYDDEDDKKQSLGNTN